MAEVELMLYATCGLAGLVWLYFWLIGKWFPAVVAAIVLGSLCLFMPAPVWWMVLICLISPWAPLMAHAAVGSIRRNRAGRSLSLNFAD